MTNTPQNPFNSVPIEVTVSVGKARPSIGDLLNLKTNAVLNLDKKVDDPVELFIGDRLIAKGQLEEKEGAQDGQMLVRLTEITSLPDGDK